MNREEILNKAYGLFNARKADELLQLMTANVDWPNGWEGGILHGRDEVKAYWLRQWAEINPLVVPQAFTELEDGRTSVSVRQTVKDKNGNILSDGLVKHVYSFDENLVGKMEIEG